MKKLCLIGADGQLGTEISMALSGDARFHCTLLTIKELDLLNTDKVVEYFSNNSFDFVINCAAYTAVDKAEVELELNDRLNYLVVEKLADLCRKQDAFFIHISTDFVFDGTKCSPWTESDNTNPLQAYGRAKLKGEASVTKGIVLRTSWLYSPYGNNFVKTMLRLGSEREQLNVVNNQIGTPTYAYDLARVIVTICLDKNYKKKNGVYHMSNEGVASWYDFACSIMEYGKKDCVVKPIPDLAFPTAAKRPNYSVLDKTKIKEQFGIEIPYWRDSLKQCIKILKEYES
tara:strand:- start:4722 stop:5582 length:861 start_codon:yes stop_codon:yes gene_type:complete